MQLMCRPCNTLLIRWYDPDSPLHREILRTHQQTRHAVPPWRYPRPGTTRNGDGEYRTGPDPDGNGIGEHATHRGHVDDGDGGGEYRTGPDPDGNGIGEHATSGGHVTTAAGATGTPTGRVPAAADTADPIVNTANPTTTDIIPT